MTVYKVAYILKQYILSQAIRIPHKSFSVRLIFCIDTYTKSKYWSSVGSESLKAFQSKGRKKTAQEVTIKDKKQLKCRHRKVAFYLRHEHQYKNLTVQDYLIIISVSK